MASDERFEVDGPKSPEDTHASITRFTPLTLGNLGAPLDFNELDIYIEEDDYAAAVQSVDCYVPQESTVGYKLDDPLIIIDQKASI